MSSPPENLSSPFAMMGGSEDLVRDLVRTFYAHMAAHEPELARVHELDEDGNVSARSVERFGSFLIEWLGGPARYTPENGHPRRRMRHGRVAIDTKMRDAWLRSMQQAMNEVNLTGPVRVFLDARFAEVADFLRNHPG
jgi:hemoglobin